MRDRDAARPRSAGRRARRSARPRAAPRRSGAGARLLVEELLDHIGPGARRRRRGACRSRPARRPPCRRARRGCRAGRRGAGSRTKPERDRREARAAASAAATGRARAGPPAIRSRLQRRHRRGRDLRARQARDPVGDRKQHVDAPGHDGERQGFEAERHRHQRQQPERHDDRRDERRGEQVAEQRIGRHALEMVGGERRGREAGDQRRERDAEQVRCPSTRTKRDAGQRRRRPPAAPPASLPDLPAGDQRGDGARRTSGSPAR